MKKECASSVARTDTLFSPLYIEKEVSLLFIEKRETLSAPCVRMRSRSPLYMKDRHSLLFIEEEYAFSI